MNKIIHLSECLWCDREMAFAHFTSQELVEAWLAHRCSIEPVVGGRYELFWDEDNPVRNSTAGCCVTAVVKPQLIAFEWKSPSQFERFANAADPLTHVVVAFVPSGNETTVHIVHSGWRRSADWEEARIWQVRAWAGALTRLRTKINGC
ncbi:SRPBCC domain-containing protein [Candidatus Fermentibacteria bacterium]|nr:SRPBCC domain-containing protein [Candidatus Fermentibacteria bacterium]